MSTGNNKTSVSEHYKVKFFTCDGCRHPKDNEYRFLYNQQGICENCYKKIFPKFKRKHNPLEDPNHPWSLYRKNKDVH